MPNILKKKITFFLFFYKSCLCAFSFIPLMRKYWCGNMVEILAGIVLRTVKYKDTQMLVDCYTRERGRISCAVTISQSRKSLSRKVMFQPLSVLEMTVDVRPNASIYRMREARLRHPYSTLPFDPVKNALALFLAEFLSYAVREETENEALYAFLEQSLNWLDKSGQPVANFHIAFLLRLSRFVGVYPYLEGYEPGFCFDLLSASYCKHPPLLHSYYIDKEEAAHVNVLMRMRYETMRFYPMSRVQRQRCLELINLFYSLHLPDFPVRLQSLDILKELFD